MAEKRGKWSLPSLIQGLKIAHVNNGAVIKCKKYDVIIAHKDHSTMFYKCFIIFVITQAFYSSLIP